MNSNDNIKQRGVFVVYLCLLIIYVFPISSNLSLLNTIHGDVYYYSRLGIIPLSILCFFQKKNVKKAKILEYVFLGIIALISYLVYGQIPWTSILVLFSIIAFDFISLEKIHIDSKKLTIFSLLFVIQIIIMFFINRSVHIGIISSFKDANYTGYFLIILYYLFDDNKKRIQYRDIFLLLSFLTFSRTAMLASIFIFLIRFFNISLKRFKYPNMIFIGVFIVWILICFIYAEKFQSIDYIYRYNTGISRLTTFFDNSNYIRSVVNIKTIEKSSFQTLLIGYSDEMYKSVVFFKGKNANPHNLPLSIYQQCGLLFSLAVVKRFIMCFKNSDKSKYIVFLLFAMVLGPSMYYGVDLILIYVAMNLNGKKDDHYNEANEYEK